MSVTVFLELNLKSENVNDLTSFMRDELHYTRGFDGCNSIGVQTNQDDGCISAPHERIFQRRLPLGTRRFSCLPEYTINACEIRSVKNCQEDYFARSPFGRLESGIVET